MSRNAERGPVGCRTTAAGRPSLARGLDQAPTSCQVTRARLLTLKGQYTHQSPVMAGLASRLRRPRPSTVRSYHSLVGSSEGPRLGVAAARRLADLGETEIAPGLTSTELARIEREYGFEFADDHRAFLAECLPFNPKPLVSDKHVVHAWEKPWPDWRHGDPKELREQLGWPGEGMLFDVEHNGVWHPSWGSRPANMTEALAKARAFLAQAPKLIPVYGHRYLPSGHGTYGHPVLSIWQSDIIIYGTDLDDYIKQEFGGVGRIINADWTPPAMVPFWSDYL